MQILVYDTTLRDGTQGENVAFSVADKLAIASKLDELGVTYIEGGWPGSNPRDAEFFAQAKNELRLVQARLVAFGSTRHVDNLVEDDPNVRMLAESGTPTVAIFGKSWKLHTERALRVSEQQNLEMIHSTVAYLKSIGREVVYDAEHFFDGYRTDRDFAFRTLEAAQTAGADCLVLCDTNGGTLTSRLGEIVEDVRKNFDGVIGIHTHNDSDVAVANAIAAVELGATHVQGTMNGYGERCGNCNLIATICDLELKLGHTVLGPENVTKLTSFANYIADMANLPLANGAAFVGKSAFAHKGGIHVSAVLRDAETYEHVGPESVGNNRRVLVSDLSGRSNIVFKLHEKGLGRPARGRWSQARLGSHQATGVRGLRTRIGGRIVRTSDSPSACARARLLPSRRHGHVDSQARAGSFRVRSKHDRFNASRHGAGPGCRFRTVRCHGRSPSALPVECLSGSSGHSPGGLQGACVEPWQRHGGQSAGSDQLDGSQDPLDDRRRL